MTKKEFWEHLDGLSLNEVMHLLCGDLLSLHMDIQKCIDIRCSLQNAI